MSVVPDKQLAKVQFYEDHVAPFTANSAAIGVAPATVTLMGTQAAAARTAYDEQQAAKQLAKAKTEAFHNAVAALSATGAGLLKAIRAKAAVAGDNVYVLAQIPAPATPSPRPAPGQPTDLKVTLDGNGALILTFKCPNPPGAGGTIYQVWRAVGNSEDFAYLGGVGARKFTDDTIPAGATRLTYRIQAARSTAVGPWATFAVSFGTGTSGGAMTASVVDAMAPKIAA